MCYLKFIAVQISSHTARHTVLTNLVSNGVLSLPDIAHLAGHRDTEMLIKVYTHPLMDMTACTLALNNLYNLNEPRFISY